MDNKTYLIRASMVALLLWGSVATVILIAQRPAPVADHPTQPAPVAAAH
jgi:hypothetical protein